MRSKNTYLWIPYFLLTTAASAQTQKFTISGTITDSNSGETLIGATVLVKKPAQSGATSNEYGFYSLTLAEGNYKLFIQYVGYHTDTLNIALTQNFSLNIKLQNAVAELKEVVVTSSAENDKITRAAGIENVSVKEMNKIPVLFGERDLLKSIQLLPGIKSTADGSSGFSVRGGAIDQNLILLDEAPVYNASHLLGFFSTFNSDAIKDLTVYKGTQPAQYGSRLSSAIDLRMKDGNKQRHEVNTSLGLITSKLSVEGPIVKDRGSFFVSARRTYVDMYLNFFSNESIRKSKLYFYDINAKANYRLGESDVLYISGYFGRDKFSIFNGYGVDWGNATATLRWNHILNSKWFSNTSLIFSDYDYLSDLENSGNGFKLNSHIRDYTLKQEFQYFPSSSHSWHFGFNTSYHDMKPGEVIDKKTSDETGLGLQNRYAWENAIYAADEWKAADWLNISAGLRFSTFSVLGKGDFYDIDNDRQIVDTLSYKPGEIAKTYFNPEPRFSASFIVNDKTSIKVSYNRNAQYLHLISNNLTGNPSDKWIPSNNNIRPETADQISLGYFQNLHNDGFEISVEGYYKSLQNQIDYKDGADVFSNNAIETQLLDGIGRAYGIEFFTKKRSGKLTGWVSYTLSRTEKKIDGINKNNWYVARQDRTHDISLVLSYDVSPRLNIASTWVFRTGNAATFPSGKYIVDQQVVWLYTERNGYRMPNYHRLDIGATYKLYNRKNFESELSLGIYNAYGQQNAFSFRFQESTQHPGTTEIVQLSLFRWIPSLSLNCKFK